MTPKEAKIIAYALQHLLFSWDEDIEQALEDIAIDKDIEFLKHKYESKSQTYTPHEL